MGNISLFIRKHQLKKKDGTKIVVSCANNRITYVNGTVDQTWIDITEDSGGAEELEYVLRSDFNSQLLYEKSSSTYINVVGESATFIKDYILGSACSTMNYFDVKLVDNVCGIEYPIMELKGDNVELCTNEGCYLNVPLRESKEKFDLFRRTSIMDNWQKWYSEDGTKEHPTFHVCIINPITFLQGLQAGFYFALDCMSIIGAIVEATGINLIDEQIKACGFGNYAVCPRIYDLLLNVCQKHGLTLNTPFNPNKEFYEDCFFSPTAGIYHKLVTGRDFMDESASGKFIYANNYIQPTDEFLNDLCEMYNLKWYVTGNTLMIEERETILKTVKADLSGTAIDGYCYTWGTTKHPAYGRYQYTVDPSDGASSEVQNLYNDIVDFNTEGLNPLLEGENSRTLRFAPTGFIGDDVNKDYLRTILDYAQIFGSILLACYSVITLGINLIEIGNKINLRRETFNDPDSPPIHGGENETTYLGTVRIVGDGSVVLPRIIRRDPTSRLKASKVVRIATNSIIPSYRNTSGVSWINQPWVTSFAGTPPFVYNYPLYFDANYAGNLYEKFDATDDPNILNLTNKEVTFKQALCCDNLDKINLDNEAEAIVGRVVKINNTENMLVTDIAISYKEMTIEYKGKLVYV